MKKTARDTGFNHWRTLPQEKMWSTEVDHQKKATLDPWDSPLGSLKTISSAMRGGRGLSLGRPEPWNCFEDLSMSEMEKKVGKIRITTDIYMIDMIGNTGAVNTSYRGSRVQRNLRDDPISVSIPGAMSQVQGSSLIQGAATKAFGQFGLSKRSAKFWAGVFFSQGFTCQENQGELESDKV